MNTTITAEPDQDAIYNQVKQEFFCSHPLVWIYETTSDNCIPAYGKQCQLCGYDLGTKNQGDLTTIDKTKVVAFNKAFQIQRQQQFRERMRELKKQFWERENEEKSKELSKTVLRKTREDRQARTRCRNEEWRKAYKHHLESEEYKSKRKLVFARDNICQACLINQATEVHHKTYDHVGDEPLFDLAGVCKACHEKLHPQED